MTDRNKITRARALDRFKYPHGITGTLHIMRAQNDRLKTVPAFVRVTEWSNPDACSCGLYDGYCPMCGKRSNPE